MQKKENQLESKVTTEHNPGELCVMLVLLIINVAFLIESLKMKGILQKTYNEGGFLPQILTATSIIMIVVLAIQYMKSHRVKVDVYNIIHYLFCREVVFLLFLVVIYVFVLKVLGFKASTLLFLFVTMLFLDRQKPLHKFAIALGTMGFIVIVFANIFQVLLP